MAILRNSANLKMIKMVMFCNQLLFTQYHYIIASGFTDEQLLSPQLENWKIVPDTFLIFKRMQNEVDPRLYQQFNREQWTPPKFNWSQEEALSVYQLSIIAIVILLVIFAAICILSAIYCSFHVLRTFFRLPRRKYEEVRSECTYMDLITDGVVNV